MVRLIDPDVRLLAALADPVRLAIVRQLAACDGICACDFTDSFEVSQPTVSHHLRVLREAGVVTGERIVDLLPALARGDRAARSARPRPRAG